MERLWLIGGLYFGIFVIYQCWSYWLCPTEKYNIPLSESNVIVSHWHGFLKNAMTLDQILSYISHIVITWCVDLDTDVCYIPNAIAMTSQLICFNWEVVFYPNWLSRIYWRGCRQNSACDNRCTVWTLHWHCRMWKPAVCILFLTLTGEIQRLSANSLYKEKGKGGIMHLQKCFVRSGWLVEYLHANHIPDKDKLPSTISLRIRKIITLPSLHNDAAWLAEWVSALPALLLASSGFHDASAPTNKQTNINTNKQTNKHTNFFFF